MNRIFKTVLMIIVVGGTVSSSWAKVELISASGGYIKDGQLYPFTQWTLTEEAGDTIRIKYAADNVLLPDRSETIAKCRMDQLGGSGISYMQSGISMGRSNSNATGTGQVCGSGILLSEPSTVSNVRSIQGELLFRGVKCPSSDCVASAFGEMSAYDPRGVKIFTTRMDFKFAKVQITKLNIAVTPDLVRLTGVAGKPVTTEDIKIGVSTERTRHPVTVLGELSAVSSKKLSISTGGVNKTLEPGIHTSLDVLPVVSDGSVSERSIKVTVDPFDVGLGNSVIPVSFTYTVN